MKATEGSLLPCQPPARPLTIHRPWDDCLALSDNSLRSIPMSLRNKYKSRIAILGKRDWIEKVGGEKCIGKKRNLVCVKLIFEKKCYSILCRRSSVLQLFFFRICFFVTNISEMQTLLGECLTCTMTVVFIDVGEQVPTELLNPSKLSQ